MFEAVKVFVCQFHPVSRLFSLPGHERCRRPVRSIFWVVNSKMCFELLQFLQCIKFAFLCHFILVLRVYIVATCLCKWHVSCLVSPWVTMTSTDQAQSRLEESLRFRQRQTLEAPNSMIPVVWFQWSTEAVWWLRIAGLPCWDTQSRGNWWSCAPRRGVLDSIIRQFVIHLFSFIHLGPAGQSKYF